MRVVESSRQNDASACGAADSLAVTWGTTADERRMPFACDRHVDSPDAAYFRGVDVHAPCAVVFRWLCQLRVAPYSYDWIDNLGRPSPRHLTPGLERLAVGQRVMTGFELIEFELDRHLTLVARPSFGRVFGLDGLAVSYVVLPRGAGDSRLVVKLLVRHGPGLVGSLVSWLLPWGDLVMMRKQLLNLKQLAEEHARGAST
ncbi:MAG TPA: hypothetical protein VJ829_16630 [Candidatus Binatia bacterium]|nr:hypothetical protein [Candidatus Binatia bacterium]